MTTARSTYEAVDDRYPSRLDARLTDASSTVPRPDPTVWGHRSGPFSAADLTAYEKNGFHIEDGLLSSSQVRECWSEFDRMATDPALGDSELLVRERGSGAIRSIFRVHRVSPLFDALARTPRILDRARQILGSEVYIHQSRINAMPGMAGTGFYWHSDFETWHAEDGLPAPRTVSLSIALTDNYPFNGGLMLMPGAHRTFVPCVGATPDGNFRESLQEQRVGVPAVDVITDLGYEFGIDQFTGDAGAGLFFDANSMHASGNNISPFPRANVFLVFNSVENAPRAPFGGTAPRPAHLAEPEPVPLTPLPDSPFA
ncbi:ectoine hydroxylase [Gordonia neofelifaecis]|uniref:Ectoine hydroxylase n=1 Tax=Gordonia neofelifaecis NRRL B-59395 TaxID=644548 RepID=F1YMF5_9ACTN|nr:ectoine hydroxylase [Gordonia neofelifaecis]EGD54080.1 ectoine hydroxylase [Gordonia neofelifaecis NRRL B-59395]